MKNSITLKICTAFAVLFIFNLAGTRAYAQIKEPDVVELPQPKTPLSEGYHNSWGVDVLLNNFGFGVGGFYSHVLGPYSELTFRTGITGLRDASEQNFQSFITGQQVIPNKYKRGFAFPFVVGLKHRLFAREIADNFRLFVAGGAGPAMAFTYPYVQDLDNNGFRTFVLISTPNGQFLNPAERVNDFFSGWGDGETHWGLDGEIKIGVDIGSSFKTKTTVEFGYFFYYFKQGLQMMEPYRPTEYNSDGLPVNATKERFFDPQKYFGTPQIKFTFGGMW